MNIGQIIVLGIGLITAFVVTYFLLNKDNKIIKG